jgi:hypothetical protein
VRIAAEIDLDDNPMAFNGKIAPYLLNEIPATFPFMERQLNTIHEMLMVAVAIPLMACLVLLDEPPTFFKAVHALRSSAMKQDMAPFLVTLKDIHLKPRIKAALDLLRRGEASLKILLAAIYNNAGMLALVWSFIIVEMEVAHRKSAPRPVRHAPAHGGAADPGEDSGTEGTSDDGEVVPGAFEVVQAVEAQPEAQPDEAQPDGAQLEEDEPNENDEPNEDEPNEDEPNEDEPNEDELDEDGSEPEAGANGVAAAADRAKRPRRSKRGKGNASCRPPDKKWRIQDYSCRSVVAGIRRRIGLFVDEYKDNDVLCTTFSEMDFVQNYMELNDSSTTTRAAARPQAPRTGAVDFSSLTGSVM